ARDARDAAADADHLAGVLEEATERRMVPGARRAGALLVALAERLVGVEQVEDRAEPGRRQPGSDVVEELPVALDRPDRWREVAERHLAPGERSQRRDLELETVAVARDRAHHLHE